MRVRIVCCEDIDSWILGKFAMRMEENLKKLGVKADIEKIPDLLADINHHLPYETYGTVISSTDTLMVTHVDSSNKLTLLKKQLQSAKMGICISKETMVNLSNLGVPRSKLCYVNPAHDDIIKPRPYVIGITCRVQNDGRKREYMLGELAKRLNPEEFSFKIMGEYWTPYVNLLRKNGFSVEYHEKFDHDIYVKLIPSLDFYLYTGMDEGQMGFMDALAAGVKTIVTAQGYHLDANGGIVYPYKTLGELLNIFEIIAEEKRRLTRSVASWNWINYTKKHLDIWTYLLAVNNNIQQFKFERKDYSDGIMSIDKFAGNHEKISLVRKIVLYKNLFKGKMQHSYYVRKNRDRGY